MDDQRALHRRVIRAIEGILARLGWCRERCFPIACEVHIELASGLRRDGMRGRVVIGDAHSCGGDTVSGSP
jgi:hypothetical protein